MKYTIQLHTDSGMFQAPEGQEVKHCSSKKDIRGSLEHWNDTVNRYSEGQCSALVWKGTLRDVTDIYPDGEATLGKRGGFRIESV
jgi:hypothetical protein